MIKMDKAMLSTHETDLRSRMTCVSTSELLRKVPHSCKRITMAQIITKVTKNWDKATINQQIKTIKKRRKKTSSFMTSIYRQARVTAAQRICLARQ